MIWLTIFSSPRFYSALLFEFGQLFYCVVHLTYGARLYAFKYPVLFCSVLDNYRRLPQKNG
jgi:hypothetical protein